jgi:RNA polymerase sigma-70 factor, ECF subfamily
MPGILNNSRMQSADQEIEPVTDSPGQWAARFEREVLAHLDRVYGAALCMADDQVEADALVQETCASAYAEFGQVEPGTKVTAWLYRILISTIASSRRGQHRPQPAPARDSRDRQQPRADPPARTWVSPAEIRAVMRLPGTAVKGALQQLHPDSRIVVYLAEVEGLACREISDITKAPIETVTWLRHCGRRQLREFLRDCAATRPGQAEACR